MHGCVQINTHKNTYRQPASYTPARGVGTVMICPAHGTLLTCVPHGVHLSVLYMEPMFQPVFTTAGL